MAVPKELDSLFDVFEQLEDSRVERALLHSLSEILLFTICGVIAGWCNNCSANEPVSGSSPQSRTKLLPLMARRCAVVPTERRGRYICVSAGVKAPVCAAGLAKATEGPYSDRVAFFS